MYIGVSSLLNRQVVERMGMGVATMPVTEMNRYTKSACRCTCIWKIIVRMDMQFNKCEWIYMLAVHDIVDYHVNK